MKFLLFLALNLLGPRLTSDMARKKSLATLMESIEKTGGTAYELLAMLVIDYFECGLGHTPDERRHVHNSPYCVPFGLMSARDAASHGIDTAAGIALHSIRWGRDVCTERFRRMCRTKWPRRIRAQCDTLEAPPEMWLGFYHTGRCEADSYSDREAALLNRLTLRIHVPVMGELLACTRQSVGE